jgi:hypothetical protein
VDIKAYELPLLDEPIPPSLGRYSKDHTKAWTAKINSFDAFVFVTAEYNHGTLNTNSQKYKVNDNFEHLSIRAKNTILCFHLRRPFVTSVVVVILSVYPLEIILFSIYSIQ